MDSSPPASSARSRMPDRPRPPSRVVGRPSAPPTSPRPSSEILSTMRPIEDSSTTTRFGVGVRPNLREALLGDPVQHELLLRSQRRDVATAPELGADAGALGEVRHL